MDCFLDLGQATPPIAASIITPDDPVIEALLTMATEFDAEATEVAGLQAQCRATDPATKPKISLLHGFGTNRVPGTCDTSV